MIRYISQKQLPLEGFDTPPGMILDPTNRWVKLKDCLPWDELSESYASTSASQANNGVFGLTLYSASPETLYPNKKQQVARNYGDKDF